MGNRIGNRWRLPMLLGFCAVLLTGCATDITKTNLKPTQTESQFSLPKLYSYEAEQVGSKLKHSLLPGTYKSWRDDEGGTYYLGPSNCSVTTIIDAGWALRDDAVGTSATANGGIYIPRQKSSPPKIFRIVGTLIDRGKLDLSKFEVGGSAEGKPYEIQDLQYMTMAQANMPNASPMAQGLAAGIGGSIVTAMTEAEKGNIQFMKKQPPDSAWASLLPQSIR
jgi:hypothetical protein